MTYLTTKALTARYDVNQSTIWRWRKKNGFPEPIKFSPQCVRWRLADIEEWDANRYSNS